MVNIKELPPQSSGDDDNNNKTVVVQQQSSGDDDNNNNTVVAQQETPDAESLSEFFLIRFPPHVASVLHELLKSEHEAERIRKMLQITFGPTLQDAKVRFENEMFPTRIVQLPTNVEVAQTTDNVNIFKTGVVSQMLVVGDHPSLAHPKDGEPWPHGICNPLKNVKKKRFRKGKRNQKDCKEAEDVKKEVKLLLQADCEAVSTRFEILYDFPKDGEENKEQEIPTEITEENLFGIVSESESESGTSQNDIVEFH